MLPQWVAREIAQSEEGLWDDLLRAHPLSRCVVPMWEHQAGWAPRRIGLFASQALVGGLALMTRRIPGLPYALGRVPYAMVGPVRHVDMLETMLSAAWHVDSSLIELELKLRIPANDSVEGFGYSQRIAERLTALGYMQTTHFDKTYLVRIDRDDAALLDSLKRHTQKSIRQAVKHGVEVAPAGGGALDTFYENYVKMAVTKGAPTMPKAVMVEGMLPLLQKGHVQLLTAGYAGRAANMAIVDTLGIPCYMLGTRTPDSGGRIPSAGQVLQFEAMKRMRDAGKVYYDMGGCEGPVPQEGHPNYGVWEFKYEFNGVYVRLLPYFRKARGPITQRLLRLIHWARGDYQWRSHAE